MYKLQNNPSPKFMKEIFQEQIPTYSLRTEEIWESIRGCLKQEIPAVKRFYRGLGTSSLQNVNINLARRGHY